MKKVVATERIPIKLWLDDIEDGAMEQAKNLANLPFTFKHIAIMPDAHFGKGPCIGAVFATKDNIVINGVGVDIGCSVSAYKTDIDANNVNKDDLKEIIGNIRKVVPFGMGNYPEPDKELEKYLDDLESEIQELYL